MHTFKLMTCAAFCLALISCSSSTTKEETATADVHLVDANGVGKSVGKVTFKDTPDGLSISTDLTGLPPGKRGFHIHEKGSCEPSMKDGTKVAANAAGGHYDPQNTGKHLGADRGGHKGDLPLLTVASDGTAKGTMTVKSLTAKEIKGRSIMIHEGGDTYSDMPEELGGGGARIACGVIR